MKRIKQLLMILMLVISLGLCININLLAEDDDEEYIELKTTYYGTNTTVKIPKTYKTKDAEMRGAWVATVWNLDIKRQNGTSDAAIEAYKAQFTKILDTLEEYHMNTVFFQVRPCNDAFYQSEINPWSQFLAGVGVDPGWDPLEWMVEETHKRGMEFQCWMNAFRTTPGSILPSGAVARQYTTKELIKYKKAAIEAMADTNYAKLHPEAVLMGSEDCMLILNPADLGVQEHIVNTLKEIVENYDVDGLHFDDYFYLNAENHSETVNRNFAGGEEYDAYLTGANTLNDMPTYEDYKAYPNKYDMPAGLNLGDFRRESINNIMKNIRAMIDEHNAKTGKHVEYGSKPAAVWQSSTEVCKDGVESADPDGSNNTCYAYQSNWNLYADTKKWVEEGWVDWVAPQVYYDFQNQEVPYADIVTWWAGIVDRTNARREAAGLKPIKMYVAHGIYLYDGHDTRYNEGVELQRQLKFNQMFDCIKGSAVYDYTTLAHQEKSVTKAGMTIFKNTWNKDVFSLPRGENNIGSAKVGDISLSKRGDIVSISFDKVENAKGYAVYKVEKGAKVSFDVENRVEILYAPYDDQKANLQLSEYDENYDYYLRVVSTTNHLSTKATLIAGQVIENQAPSTVIINLNDDKDTFLYNTVTATLPYSVDPEGDNLTYEVKISVNGIEGRYYNVDAVKETENGLEIKWDPFVTGEDCVIKVVISDGEKSVTCYSNSIRVVETEDDLKTDKPVDCDKNPDHEDCKDDPTPPVVDCDKNPEHEDCKDDPTPPVVDCDKNPEHEDCKDEPTPPVDDQKGCKKDLLSVVVSLISLSALGVLFIKKRQ